jgi:hypothetical protein
MLEERANKGFCAAGGVNREVNVWEKHRRGGKCGTRSKKAKGVF